MHKLKKIKNKNDEKKYNDTDDGGRSLEEGIYSDILHFRFWQNIKTQAIEGLKKFPSGPLSSFSDFRNPLKSLILKGFVFDTFRIISGLFWK